MLIAAVRRREFGRLDAQRLAYLDYTGSALYGESQLREHFALLRSGLFGNPHSESAPSQASSEMIAHVRHEVLAFFDVDDSTHDVIFTANATAAIKLVAESYPFSAETRCVLSADNHNSVNGIREFARRAQAPVTYLGLDRELRLIGDLPAGPGLFAFPAQSNFSGVLHALSLVDDAHARGLDVLVDGAAFVASHALSLRTCKADFVALSFYKMFGYPTGIGALIARRGALSRLRRPWFSGGTVTYAAVQADKHRLRSLHEGFEDGSPDFLGIAAVPTGLSLLKSVGMDALETHVSNLTAMLLESLNAIERIEIYGPCDTRDRGGAVAFNIEGVPYWELEQEARQAGVAVRGGCFCNPGASEIAFGIDGANSARCFDALGEDFTIERFAMCAGKTVGAVRISVGLANNEDDVLRAVEVLRRRASARQGTAPMSGTVTASVKRVSA
jgi:selenocysteine lyase/cysteine desulfurase